MKHIKLYENFAKAKERQLFADFKSEVKDIMCEFTDDYNQFIENNPMRYLNNKGELIMSVSYGSPIEDSPSTPIAVEITYNEDVKRMIKSIFSRCAGEDIKVSIRVFGTPVISMKGRMSDTISEINDLDPYIDKEISIYFDFFKIIKS